MLSALLNKTFLHLSPLLLSLCYFHFHSVTLNIILFHFYFHYVHSITFTFPTSLFSGVRSYLPTTPIDGVRAEPPAPGARVLQLHRGRQTAGDRRHLPGLSDHHRLLLREGRSISLTIIDYYCEKVVPSL